MRKSCPSAWYSTCVPSDTHAEPKPSLAQDIDLRRLLRHQHSLALGENEDAGDELEPPCDAGHKPKEHKRLVKHGIQVVRTAKIRTISPVSADHVVVREEVSVPQFSAASVYAPTAPTSA